MEILRTKSFQKAYDRLAKNIQQRVDDTLTLFITDRTNPMLRDHPLKGKLKGFRSFSAAWDLRIVYQKEGDFVVVILINAGTHNQIY